ncbi:DUF7093 family protein [Halostella litorea]|uniref:DUF7093 family protein n=1 Tax=Halostella litorea TaxID=2528831 RepID=UPI00109333BC|nr:hypothetical protein [Halostella litorea]
MGLRCSLLGHDFGETEVEREREEQGSEVVETVREVRTCGRCGETKLVSENTNVTTLDRSGSTPDPAGEGSQGEAADAATAADPTPAADTATADAPDGAPADASASADAEPPADGDDAEILDESAAEPDDAGGTDTAADAVTEAEDAPGEPADAADPADDDGVILDETDEEPAPDREYGQWPDSDDTGEPEPADSPTKWPEQRGEDQGYDAELSDGDADVEFGGGGLTPEVDADAADVAGEETVGGSEPADTGITSAGTAPSPDAPADTTEVDTEFFCPECEQVTPADRSSLRAGDICPECKHGYITERER